MRSWGWTTLPTATPSNTLMTVLNRKLSLLTQWIEDAGDYLSGVGGLQVNAVQPPVAGKRMWRVTNTSATSITALREGRSGQMVILWFDNANTTLVHSATLQLVGAVNYVGAADTALMLATVDGTIWRELLRR